MPDINGIVISSPISLDGPWRYLPCLGNDDCPEFYRPDFNDADWDEMNVPSNWYLQGLDHNGTVLFRKEFSVDGECSFFRLWFGGVDYDCRVWLNREFLGEHTGYFEAFEFDVTNLIKVGSENLLAVQVNCPDDPGFPFAKQHFKGGLGHWDMRPGGWSTRGQEHGSGGIWQSVLLKKSGPCAISRVKAAPVRNGDAWNLNLEVDIGAQKDTACEVSISLTPSDNNGEAYNLCAKPMQLTRGKNTWAGSLTVENPKLWWTWDHGKPELYDLNIKTFVDGELSDNSTERIGFRTVDWRDDGLHLNDRRIFLKGSCYISSIYLSETTDERIRQDLELACKANMNSLRIPYHVEPRGFYELCDETGILIQAEFPMLWDYDTSPHSRNECARQVRAMVDQLHNHPCIFKWVCHCEPTSIANRKMDKELIDSARQAERTGREIDASSKISDHPFFGWYIGSMAGFAAQPGGTLPSEFGAESLPDARAGLWEILGDKKWPPNQAWEYHNFQPKLAFPWKNRDTLEQMIESSQEYQAKLLDFAIQSFRRGKGSVFGSYLFTFVDAWPSITWSIIDHDRRPKSAYHAVARAYKPLKLSIDILSSQPRNPFTAPAYWNDHFDRDRDFRARLWLINDTHESIKAELKWKVSGPAGELLTGGQEILIKADSAEVAVEISQHLDKDLPVGKYLLDAELLIDSSIADREAFDFYVTRPGGRLINAFESMTGQLIDDLRHVLYFATTFSGHYLDFIRGKYNKK